MQIKMKKNNLTVAKFINASLISLIVTIGCTGEQKDQKKENTSKKQEENTSKKQEENTSKKKEKDTSKKKEKDTSKKKKKDTSKKQEEEEKEEEEEEEIEYFNKFITQAALNAVNKILYIMWNVKELEPENIKRFNEIMKTKNKTLSESRQIIEEFEREDFNNTLNDVIKKLEDEIIKKQLDIEDHINTELYILYFDPNHKNAVEKLKQDEEKIKDMIDYIKANKKNKDLDKQLKNLKSTTNFSEFLTIKIKLNKEMLIEKLEKIKNLNKKPGISKSLMSSVKNMRTQVNNAEELFENMEDLGGEDINEIENLIRNNKDQIEIFFDKNETAEDIRSDISILKLNIARAQKIVQGVDIQENSKIIMKLKKDIYKIQQNIDEQSEVKKDTEKTLEYKAAQDHLNSLLSETTNHTNSVINDYINEKINFLYFRESHKNAVKKLKEHEQKITEIINYINTNNQNKYFSENIEKLKSIKNASDFLKTKIELNEGKINYILKILKKYNDIDDDSIDKIKIIDELLEISINVFYIEMTIKDIKIEDQSEKSNEIRKKINKIEKNCQEAKENIAKLEKNWAKKQQEQEQEQEQKSNKINEEETENKTEDEEDEFYERMRKLRSE